MITGWTTRKCRWAGLAAAALLGAACSGGSSSAPSSSTASSATPTTAVSTDSSPGTAPAPSTAAPSSAAPTTTPAPVVLPAGLQFGTSPEIVVPFSFNAAVTADGERLVALGRAGSADIYEATDIQAQIIEADGTQQLVTVDDYSGYKNPPGYGSFRGFNVTDVAHSSTGFVAAGYTNIWDSRANRRVTARSLAWFSTDAITWTRFDFRSLVGEVNLQIGDVEPLGSGFVAAGTIAVGNGQGDLSNAVVFTSPDGVTWTKGAEMAGRWSVEARHVMVLGQRVVVTGVEYACTDDAGAMFTFSNGSQVRMWASDDGGATFTALDPSAGGLIVEPNPAPADAADCPENVVFESNELYQSRARVIWAAGDHLVVWSADGTKAAISTDGETWTVGEVPDAMPVVPEGSTVPEPSSATVTFDGDRFVLLSEELRRNEDGSQLDAGNQILGWASTDGATWERLPLARPVTPGTYDDLLALDDGSVLLRRTVQLVNSTVVTFERSVAGELVPWDTCTPAPGANCGFTKLSGVDLSGADLRGIDWRGAELDGVNLSGANLEGARLDGARIIGTNLTGAKLAGARFFSADLGPDVDLAGADLTGASFVDTKVPDSIVDSPTLAAAILQNAQFGTHEADSFAGASFAGVDLSGAKFDHRGGLLDLTGADFTGATVLSTYFGDVDLTGAKLTGLELGSGLIISAGATCPDGQPPTEGKYGLAACRL